LTINILTLLLLALLGLFLIFTLGKPLFRYYRRKQLKSSPFPPEWEEILSRSVALYRHLPDSLKKELQGYIQIFLSEKTFEGCGGLKITDEIKVTIAGQACILLLNRKPTYYPKLFTILVYPSAYVAKQVTVKGMEHTEEMTVRGGESWGRGEVVLGIMWFCMNSLTSWIRRMEAQTEPRFLKSNPATGPGPWS
jgi:Mlc titration factor MtfA (ptsG expression regulator)